MSDPSELPQEPANLRLLRMLVTTLLGVMILGFIVLIALFVMRFSGEEAARFPESITLPEGVTALSFTQTPDWVAVTGSDNVIRIYDPSGETLRQEIPIR